jgi:hypothetical protein
MYFDDESDSDSDSALAALLRFSEPHLCLYDEDEAETRSYEVRLPVRIKDTRPSETSMQEEILPKYHKLFRVLRFFKAYEGFHTVGLTDYEPRAST